MLTQFLVNYGKITRNFLKNKALLKFSKRYKWNGEFIPVIKDTGPIEYEVLNSSVAANYFAAYDEDSFTLSTGTRIVGPCAVLPMNIFHWNVAHSLEITEESLAMFFVLEPKLDIIIIGKGAIKEKVDVNTFEKLSDKYNINIEVLPTVNAIGTFNILNQEQRYVGAALIPPRKIDIYDNDLQELKRIKARENFDLPLIDTKSYKVALPTTWSDRRKLLLEDKKQNLLLPKTELKPIDNE